LILKKSSKFFGLSLSRNQFFIQNYKLKLNQFFKTQGPCNSCWAFSAAGIVDAVMRKKNITVEVSPQVLLDCSTKFCWGCQSGWPKYALDFVKTNGITLREDYPYLAEEDACTYSKDKAVAHVNATYIIPTRGDIIKFSKSYFLTLKVSAGNETWLRYNYVEIR
jgi:Papain family cysteine protease